jgi:hypothetical protein
VVVKVIGASCKCVSPELCEKRDELTQTERSFGARHSRPSCTSHGGIISKKQSADREGVRYVFAGKAKPAEEGSEGDFPFTINFDRD